MEYLFTRGTEEPLLFTTQADILRYIFDGEIPGWARFNLWKHLKREDGSFKSNTFYGCIISKL